MYIFMGWRGTPEIPIVILTDSVLGCVNQTGGLVENRETLPTRLMELGMVKRALGGREEERRWISPCWSGGS
jgi:hypothetical protein